MYRYITIEPTLRQGKNIWRTKNQTMYNSHMQFIIYSHQSRKRFILPIYLPYYYGYNNLSETVSLFCMYRTLKLYYVPILHTPRLNKNIIWKTKNDYTIKLSKCS